MSVVMASDEVTGYAEDTSTLPSTDECDSQTTQTLEEVESRLGTLSENINLCNIALKDLKDLRDLLARKSLQDVSTLPQQ